MNFVKKTLSAVTVACVGLGAVSASATCGSFSPPGVMAYCSTVATTVYTSSPQNLWVYVPANNCPSGGQLYAYGAAFFYGGTVTYTPYFTAANWHGWTWGKNILWHAPYRTCVS